MGMVRVKTVRLCEGMMHEGAHERVTVTSEGTGAHGHGRHRTLPVGEEVE